MTINATNKAWLWMLVSVCLLSVVPETLARVYVPSLGRWTTRDRAGYVDGPSVYQYVRGGPIMGVDPTGLLMLPVDLNKNPLDPKVFWPTCSNCTGQSLSECTACCQQCGGGGHQTACESCCEHVWIPGSGKRCNAAPALPPVPPPQPGCPPCTPKPPRIDRSPPSKAHWPCPGDHRHQWQNCSQSPAPACKCRCSETVECL